MSLRAKAEAAAKDITAQMDCIVMQYEGDAARKMIADAIERVAREFAEKALRLYAKYRVTSYTCTPEQLLQAALGLIGDGYTDCNIDGMPVCRNIAREALKGAGN